MGCARDAETGLLKVSAIVLAAGASRRMGRPKQLLAFGQGTMLGGVIESLLLSRVQEVVVVLGHRAEEVRSSIVSSPVRVVINPEPDRGMFSSVQCGLGAASSDADALLIALGDQPFLRPELIDALIQAFRGHSLRIVAPTWRGRRGHPILLGAVYAPEIMGMGAGSTLRDLVRRHAEDILEVSVRTDDVLRDIDTPEEYEEARRDFGSR